MSLSGFITDVHCASESNLELEVDCSHIDWNEYKELILELEDLLSDIDERHSVRSWLVKGRGLRARYRRVSAEDRRKRLHFSPFPSRFVNVLKNTRTYIYNLVAENCLVLESVGRRKVYLLPKHLAPFFVEAIERINEDVIKPLRKEIEDFRQSDDYLKIKQTLYGHKVDPSILDRAVFPIGNFMVDVLPIDFGYSVDIDEAYAKMNRTKAAKGLEILDRQIERRRRKYAMSAVSDVVNRILEMAEGLGGKGRKVRDAVKKVERLMEICDSLELREVNERVLKPLTQICEARYYQRAKLSEELFGEKNLKEGVDKELKRLLPSFGGP